MPLALGSHNTNGVFNNTTAFLRSRKLKGGATWLLLVMWHHSCWHWCHMMLMALSMAPLHSLNQDDQNEWQHDLFGLWRQQHYQWHHCIPWVRIIEVRCNMTFWLRSAFGTSISITSCWWHCQWYHYIHRSKQWKWGATRLLGHVKLLALTLHDVDGIISGSTALLRSRQLKWDATWLVMVI